MLFAHEFEAIDQTKRQLTADSVLRDEARQHRERYQEGLLNLTVQRSDTELSKAYQRLGRAVADWRSSNDRSDATAEMNGHAHELAGKDIYDSVNAMVYAHMETLIRRVDSGTSSATQIDAIRTARDEILKDLQQMAGSKQPGDVEWQPAVKPQG